MVALTVVLWPLEPSLPACLCRTCAICHAVSGGRYVDCMEAQKPDAAGGTVLDRIIRKPAARGTPQCLPPAMRGVTSALPFVARPAALAPSICSKPMRLDRCAPPSASKLHRATTPTCGGDSLAPGAASLAVMPRSRSWAAASINVLLPCTINIVKPSLLDDAFPCFTGGIS